ncbi:MAG: Asp23/Gls24 family envelope stress response protein [Clostridiales Family XIII bacterium]|nr:Asp23/Gls24 family envelope stress response protein [Clostridiales Family XIII bacterium]
MANGTDIDGLGKITISEELIADCVREAVLNTNGVYGLAGGFSDAFSQNILGKELKFKGMKISEAEEGIVIDVHILVVYGVKIPEIAWVLQKKIKNSLEEMTDAAVKAVNIVVQGVRAQTDKADEDE